MGCARPSRGARDALQAFIQGQGPINGRRLAGIINSATNAWLSKLLNASSPAPFPAMRLKYLRDMPKAGSQLSLDFASLLGPLFYTWLSQLLLPVMTGMLVYEKERNLRTMMKMQGLGNGAYWLINYAYYFVLHLVFMLLIWFFGAVLSIKLFTLSQGSIIIVFFILFINVQIAIAFLMNSIFSSAKTAQVLCIVYLLLSGLLGEFLFRPYIETATFPRSGVIGMMILVPFSLYRHAPSRPRPALTDSLSWADASARAPPR